MYKHILVLVALFVLYLQCSSADLPSLPLQRIFVYSSYTNKLYAFNTDMQPGSAYVFKLSRYTSSSSLNDVDQLKTLYSTFSPVNRFRTDRFEKKVYFSQGNSIIRMNPDGSNQEGVHLSSKTLVGDFAVDDIHRNLFIMRQAIQYDSYSVELVRISLDTHQEHVIKTSLYACSAMQVDPVNNLLYIVQNNRTSLTDRKYLLVISTGGYELDRIPLYEASSYSYSCDDFVLAINRDSGMLYIGNMYTLEYLDYVHEQRGVILYPSDWTNAFYSSSQFSDLVYEENSKYLYMLRSSGEALFIDVSTPRPSTMTVFFTMDTPLGLAVVPCEAALGACGYTQTYDATVLLTVLGFTTVPVLGLLVCVVIVCVKNRRERLLQGGQLLDEDEDSDEDDGNEGDGNGDGNHVDNGDGAHNNDVADPAPNNNNVVN